MEMILMQLVSLAGDDHSESYIFVLDFLITITITVPWAVRKQASLHLAFHTFWFLW